MFRIKTKQCIQPETFYRFFESEALTFLVDELSPAFKFFLYFLHSNKASAFKFTNEF